MNKSNILHGRRCPWRGLRYLRILSVSSVCILERKIISRLFHNWCLHVIVGIGAVHGPLGRKARLAEEKFLARHPSFGGVPACG